LPPLSVQSPIGQANTGKMEILLQGENETVFFDLALPFATSEGCRIYYRLEGVSAKRLLVLVHSLGADHGMWDPQMAALLRYFQVLRLDVRGH
jgi:hypothetical protein